jgi:hypothetical protein
LTDRQQIRRRTRSICSAPRAQLHFEPGATPQAKSVSRNSAESANQLRGSSISDINGELRFQRCSFLNQEDLGRLPQPAMNARR